MDAHAVLYHRDKHDDAARLGRAIGRAAVGAGVRQRTETRTKRPKTRPDLISGIAKPNPLARSAVQTSGCGRPDGRVSSGFSFHAERVVLIALIQIVNLLISLVTWLVIIQFVLSLLISFNVVNTHNDFVAALWRAINALLDPLLRPIRRIMPETGTIDFSPMVLIVGLQIVEILLRGVASSMMGL
jgi:YggT family protein